MCTFVRLLIYVILIKAVVAYQLVAPVITIQKVSTSKSQMQESSRYKVMRQQVKGDL